jgi:hypothetical protein
VWIAILLAQQKMGSASFMASLVWLTTLTVFPMWIMFLFVIAFSPAHSTDPWLRRLPAKEFPVAIRITRLNEMYREHVRNQLGSIVLLAFGLIVACALFMFLFEREDFFTTVFVLFLFFLFIAIGGTLFGGSILLARYVNLRRHIGNRL